MVILRIYAGAIELNKTDTDQRKAMLFAQNYIEDKKDVEFGVQSYDSEFKNKGDYFEVTIKMSEKEYPLCELVISHEGDILVEYSFYDAEVGS